MSRSTAILSVVAALFAIVPTALAAEQTRDQLKTYFETGDVPTQDQFSITSLTGDPSPLDPPDFNFRRGTGISHIFEGLGNSGLAPAEMLSDGNGHALILGAGEVLRPTSGQFASLIDSSLSIMDDRYLIGLRFHRPDGMHYGFLDVSINSPLSGWPDYNALVVHGWAFESQADATITTHFIPAPGTGVVMFGAIGMLTRRRRT